ncbi:site-specific integrase [Paenibacillus sp. GYB004]|uniref:tyrosine-type recombinase/integrase n=1 Tax=Paenibacillus sp. GYB004 TaxID=2994393 RepID=UPI002F968E3E
MDQDSKNVINELNSSNMPQNDQWKKTISILWNASSIQIFGDGINPTNLDQTEAIWDVSEEMVRSLMEEVLRIEENGSVERLGSKGINDWLWEQKVIPNIKLQKIRALLKEIKIFRTPYQLYSSYLIALHFQSSLAVIVNKSAWQISDSDVTKENIIIYCKRYLEKKIDFNFIKKLAKEYYPESVLRMPDNWGKKSRQEQEPEIHPYLDRFAKHLTREGNSTPYVQRVTRYSLFFLSWLTEVFASFQDHTASTIPIWLIEREHLIQFKEYLERCEISGKYTDITASNIFYEVISFFKYLYDVRAIRKNIGSIDGIKANRYRYRDIPDQDQLSRFFQTLQQYSDEPEYDSAFFGSLLLLGLRFCECERLAWSDVNLEAGIIRIRGKGRRNKSTPMLIPPTLRLYFKQLNAVTTHKCTRIFNIYLDTQKLYREMLKKYKLYSIIANWNFPGGFHLFRHTFITTLSKNKRIHPELLQRLARHERIDTTAKYSHRQDSVLQEAMEKIDQIWRD